MGHVFYHPSEGGEIVVDYYPVHFDQMENKPILFFYYGAFGYEKAAYVQGLLKLMDEYKWRGVFMNRRGFGTVELKNASMLGPDELNDYVYVAQKLKKKWPKSNFYLMGVSAGSCYAARLLGEYPDKMPFKAFVSLCNPFNIGQVTYHMDRQFFSKNLSRAITLRAKILLDHHRKNPIFNDELDKRGVDLDKLKEYTSRT